jgi:hypothetical protein
LAGEDGLSPSITIFFSNTLVSNHRFPFMMLMAVNKEENKFNFKEVIVSALKSLRQIKQFN